MTIENSGVTRDVNIYSSKCDEKILDSFGMAHRFDIHFLHMYARKSNAFQNNLFWASKNL